MSHIYVAGIAMTVFGRHPERELHDLAGEALQGALNDAGCTTRDLGVAYYAGMTNGPLQGQISIPGQVVFSKIGIEGIPIYNVENACASGSSAFNLAVQSLKAGTADVALAIGAEKMNVPDKARAFAIFDGGWDVSSAAKNHGALGSQPVLAVPQVLHHRRGARGSADHLPDHPADVRSAFRRRRRPTRSPASAQRTWTSPRSTTRRRWARSCRPRTWASRRSAPRASASCSSS